MEQLAKFLQTNAYAVVALIIIGVISAVIGLPSAWPTFREHLKRKMQIPNWGVWLLCVMLSYFLINKFGENDEDDPSKYELIEAKTFGNQRLVLDGKRFYKCDFLETNLVIEGKQGFSMERCYLKGSRIVWGGSARKTFTAMTELYKIPEMKPIINQFIEDIKKDSVPVYMPPQSY